MRPTAKSDEERAREVALRLIFGHIEADVSDEDSFLVTVNQVAFPVAAFAAAIRAEATLAERERIAKWFESRRIEESGADYGLADLEERWEIRDHNRRVMGYAAAIRKGK